MNLLNFCILYSILYCCLNYAFYAVDLNILNAMANSVEPNQSDLVFTVFICRFVGNFGVHNSRKFTVHVNEQIKYKLRSRSASASTQSDWCSKQKSQDKKSRKKVTGKKFTDPKSIHLHYLFIYLFAHKPVKVGNLYSSLYHLEMVYR